VQINIPNINLQSALNQQEANFVTPEQAIASSCLARRNAQQGSFTVTGTGGLPVTPYDALQSQYAVTNVQPLGKERGTSSAPLSSPSRQASSPKSWKLGDPIQEAQGMTLSADGRLIVGTASQLVAAAQAKDLVCYSSAP
jgi:large exoprotein involved in heme utilization and adhesion